MTPSREFIANQLVFPSYISLEYALSYHNLIPERVYQVTSITSKKTTEFENAFGVFTYHNLKPGLFFGYRGTEDENGLQVLIAEKEKALLDYQDLLLKADRQVRHLIYKSNSKLCPYSGISTCQPKCDSILPCNDFAASGSPCTRKVFAGGLLKPMSQARISL